MALEETFGELLGLCRACRIIKERLEASLSTFVLKVEETCCQPVTFKNRVNWTKTEA
jgi:hypothetical protein